MSIDTDKLKKEWAEAHEKLLQTEWKTVTCGQGEICWCRGIQPVTEIRYSGDEEMYVARTGEINKETAEYIVKLHNKKIGK